MQLRKTIELAHKCLSQAGIEHALIGGIALGSLGVNRATADLDLLIDENDYVSAKSLLLQNGFTLRSESAEVAHFSGIGYLDLLLARRPMSREMLKRAKALPPLNIKCVSAEDIIGLKIQAYKNDSRRELRDKADIQQLIELYQDQLDWNRIRQYADLFSEWTVIESLKRDKK